MKTRLTEMLGIELPIIQGGMQHLGVPELASVVSNAGGAGTINRTCYKDNDAFREGLRQMNEMTNKPYFVNISLLPGVNVGDDVLETIRICGEMGVKAIETAGSRPGQLVPLIHEQGMLHFQKVPGARYAKSAERAGVDAVNVVGFECAGHPSMKAIGSVVCTRKAAKICSIPVIAGGGYADGYGMAGAIAMGAEGVIMGTRFVATQECTIHPNFKEWIVNATEDDTLLCQKSIKNMVRVANNDCAKECLQMESQGASLQELLTVIGGARGRKGYESGDVNYGMFPVGNDIGLIDDIPTVAQMMQQMVEEFKDAVERMTRMI